MSTYIEENFMTLRIDDNGKEVMSNFIARITEEIRYTDGVAEETTLKLKGWQKDPTKPDEKDAAIELPEVEMEAKDFASMAWVLPKWGVRAVIRPGTSIKDDLRTAIQMGSVPKIRTVYRHIGWTKEGSRSLYIHAGGAIGKNGNDSSVKALLPNELRKFLIEEMPIVESVKASIELASVKSLRFGWPLLATTLAPLFGSTDFAIHISGRTGSFKSEIMSLFQSHYGVMNARNLPGSWSSTANALEALAYYAKNAAFTIDDFIPAGTAWQQRSYQQIADKIIRAQGNQAGRARLTDISSLQVTMYPRGSILSTGEDVPEGHSVRARMMISEITPGDIKPTQLSSWQKKRELYQGTTFHLIKYIAANDLYESEVIKALSDKYRDECLGIGHTRTPSMMGKMVAVIDVFLEFAATMKVISEAERTKLLKEAKSTIFKIGGEQQQYLEDADPVDIFLQSIRNVLSVGTGHIRSISGGVPKQAEILGWTVEHPDSDMPSYKARGATIGWVKWDEGIIFIDTGSGYNIIKKNAGAEMSLTKNTLIKRIKDSGELRRTDENRQRNTVRITADGHPRTVIALSAAKVLQSNEEK